MFIPASFFSTDIFWSSLKWLMILIVWGIFAYGTWQEDRKINLLLAKGVEEKDAVTILRTLHRRDMRIWLQVSLLLLVMATNDIHHDAAQLPADFFTPPLPVPPPPAPVAAVETPNDRYDKILKKSAASALPFSNITEFNEQNGKREAYIDWLKERYESWLITYYYLERCKKTNPGDYEFIAHSLDSDLKAASAGPDVASNILLAATGSYKEMYSDIPCDSEHVATTKSSFDANMQQAKLGAGGTNATQTKPSAVKTR